MRREKFMNRSSFYCPRCQRARGPDGWQVLGYLSAAADNLSRGVESSVAMTFRRWGEPA
jgi:hypothetical protein